MATLSGAEMWEQRVATPDLAPSSLKHTVQISVAFSSTLSIPTLKFLGKYLPSLMNCDFKPTALKIFADTDCTSLTMELGPLSDPSLELRKEVYEDAVNAGLNTVKNLVQEDKEDSTPDMFMPDWSVSRSIITITCDC
jgi:hypothetical protein